MSFLLRRLGPRLGLALSLSVLAAPTACSTGADGSITPVTQPPPDSKDSVRFDDAGTLELGLGAPAVLRLTASSRVRSIGFTLVGASLDASLDANVVSTDAFGHAAVTLLAPSQATTFHVRATVIDGASEALGDGGAATPPSVERAVAVSNQGFGTVRVSPQYLGERAITTWTANVVAKVSCKSLQATLPADPPGALTGTAPSGGKPVIAQVPVGADLAVTLRAGHFAWGCAPAPTLTAGGTVDVPVMVIDKPLDLSAASLAATFIYSGDPTAYPAFLEESVGALDDAFMPAGTGEGTIVLNAMAAAYGTQPGAFAQQRIDLGWDAVAALHFASLPRGLRDTCAAWATAGLALQPTSFEANVAAGAQPGQALLAVTQLGALDPATVGAVGASSGTWTVQPGDVVLLSGALSFEPSRFAGASSLTPALSSQPAAANVAGALSLAADCEGLAAALGAFPGCDVGCMAELCSTAITVRWQSALGASKEAAALAQLAFKASANATIDDYATPTMLDGHWLGTVDVAPASATSATVKGDMMAKQAASVPFTPP